MIYSGNLTETLDFYSVEEIQSPSGYKETEETYKYTVRAQRMKNKEYFEDNAGEMFHLSTLTFRFRKKDIEETDIVCYRQERYVIISIDEYRNEMTITVQKINE